MLCYVISMKRGGLFSIEKVKQRKYKTDVINDSLSETHSPAISNQYFHLKVVLFCKILKSGDEQTDRRTDEMCENSDHYRL